MKDRKVPVAVHLTDEEYRYFKLAYANHNSSMGLKERQHYNASSIVLIKKNKRKNCLEVYYQNGDWWHYTPDGKWY